MKYNLTIATTPMQIVNAIEAINHFKLTNNILVITLKPRKKNNEQLEKIASLYKWDKIIKVNEKLKKNKFLEYIKLIYKLKKNSYDYIFFGSFTSIYKIIIANLQKNKLYLIDDGTYTLNMYNNVFLKNKHYSIPIKNLRFLFAGLKIKFNEPISFFTYFNLQPDKRFKIVKNELKYFTAKKSNKENHINKIFFLGQPLVSLGFMSEKDYIDSIKFIINSNEKKIIYIPHRFEKISDALKELENDNFKVKEVDLPIELYFIYKNIYPTHLISYCTSAAFILDKIYPNLLSEYILIAKNKFLKKQKEFYDCYNSLSEQTKSKAVKYE